MAGVTTALKHVSGVLQATTFRMQWPFPLQMIKLALKEPKSPVLDEVKFVRLESFCAY